MADPHNLYRYFVKLSYNGTAFNGWQRQPNGTSVQQVLENGLSLLLKTETMLVGAGRTDTGVHAQLYYAHFDVPFAMDEEGLNELQYKLNRFLPYAIAIHRIFPVDQRAHARFSALLRTYKYYIVRAKSPFREPFTHYYWGHLDVNAMNAGAEILLNTHDFTSFSKVDTDTKTNLCEVKEALWVEQGDELVFTITANRFLRNMVRAITGTLLELGRNRINLDDFQRIIDGRNRCDAGDSVPAKGLHLVEITYPDGMLNG